MGGFGGQPQVNFVGGGQQQNTGFSSFQSAQPQKQQQDTTKISHGGLVDLNNLQMQNT